MKKIRKGFTLVEVICVLTIIAIIAAIAVPNISGYIEKSKINNCRSIMTDFVNDLEYKIVSKRYYDINELNDELVEYVKNSSAVEPKIEYTETDNGRKTSVEAKICPNDGTYKLSWTISPNIDSESNVTDIYTANVKVSDCVCKCVTGENSVVHTGHDFTAALVASEYIDSGKTPEQKYEEIINGIIDDVGESTGGTGNLAGIVDEVEGKNPGYEIAGLTTTLDKKVEWISVYYHDTFSAEESKYKFLTKSGGKSGELIIKNLTETEFNDKSNWPPAEGTSGSFVFKEGWNKDVVYYVADLDVIDPTTNKSIGWIQRDGNWYVQKSNDVKGIDLTVDKNDENSTLSGHPLISDDRCKLKDNDAAKGNKLLKIQATSNPDWSNLKKSLQIVAEYENGNKITFDHISATDLTKDDYSIKNGFIILSSESDVSSKKWAGIYENSANSEKTTLQSLLDNEDELIGKFLSGENSELIIAYQEYHKTYDAKTKVYSSVPITCFGKLVRDENSTPGKIYIKNEDNDVIFTIGEVQTTESNYEISYNQSPESNNKFRVEDLSIKKTVTHIIKDENDNTIYTFEDDVEIKHVEENDDNSTLRFYIGNYKGYSKDKENECVANLNNGYGTAWIFLGDVSLEYDKWSYICQIDTCNSDGYSWNYEKGQNDNEFDVNKINVSISYKLSLRNTSYRVSIEGSNKIVHELSHRTESNSNDDPNGFFYISESNSNEDTYYSIEETGLINKINSCAAKAYIKIYKSGDRQYGNNHTPIGFVNTYLNSVTADYTNDGSAFSFDKLTASAGYIIEFKDYDGAVPHEQINHFISLNHDDNSDNRYYMSLDDDCNNDWSERNDVKDNEQSTITKIYEILYEKTKCKAYVVFYDKRTRCDDIYINVTSSINPPDVVYIPDSEGSTDARMIAYIGTNQNVTVPASHTGYWSEIEPAGGVDYVMVQASGLPKYYYIDDGKTYNIKRIGADSSALPQGNEDSIKIKFPSGVKVQSLDISEGVKEIGPYAFSKLAMEGEGSIKIPDSVETIGVGAFADCGGNYFNKLELGTVTANNGEYISSSKLRTIGASAFQNCNSLTATDVIVIPESVTSIGDNAFSDFRLANATLVLNGVSEYREKNTSTSTFTENNVNSAKALTVNGVDYEGVITKKIFGDGNQLTVNTLVIGGNVERIDNDAFKGTQFNSDTSSVVIKGNVETIGASAFQETNFASGLVIGDKVKYIEASAFEGCSTYSGNLSLNNVVKIGQNAFKGCTNITGGLVIPETVEFIGQYAFDSFASNHSFDIVNNECKVGELVIRGGSSNQGHTLGGLIFTNAKFNNVRIEGNKITEISAYAFKNSPIDSKTPYNNIKGALEISSSVTNIGKSAFENCTGFNGSLILPEGLTVINDATFNGCLGFTGDLTIPSSVTQIGSRAFMGCVGMNGSLTLSNNLKKIGMEAFKDCINFGNGLKIPETVTDGIGNCAFQQFAKNTSNPGLLEINAGSYSNGTKLGSFLFTEAKFNGIKVGGIVQEISANAFHHEQSDELDLNYYDPDDPDNKSTTSSGGETTTEVSLSKTTLRADYSGITGSLELEAVVTTVGEYAFYDCKGINGTISLSKVTSIGSHAFEDCSNLTGITKLESVQTIGDSAFENCSNMSGDLSFPSTLTSIGSRAFYNGSSIKLVSIPESVTSIGSSAFENSGSGSSLAIYGCSGKETVDGKEVGVFGDGTNSENSIFRNAHYSNITIGGSVITIKEKAFQGCTGLTGTLTISGYVEEIQKLAFADCEYLTGLSLKNNHIQKIYEGAFARCKRVEGGLCIPPTVNYMERCAFKQFAELTPDYKIGKLEVYGTSDANGNLGDPDPNNDGVPLFSSAHFKDVIIGGNVRIINYSQFNNRLFYDFGEDLKDTNNNVIDSPLGGSDNYDFSGISGDLIIKDGVEKIGAAAFFAMQFDNVTIPKSVKEIHPKAFLFTGTGNGSLTVLGASNGGNTLGDGINPIFLGSKFNGVTIGGSVKHIGNDLFHNMDNYSNYTCEEEINKQKVNVKYNYTYSDIKGNLTIEDVVETIGQSAFESCNFDGRLLLGEKEGSVKLSTIGQYAFKNCNNFTGDLVIPHSVTSMGNNSFYRFAANSSKPGALVLWAGSSENGHTIDTEIFVGSQFHNVLIDGNVYKIADSAFINYRYDDDTERLYNLSGTLSIGAGVTSIGKEAFKCCTFDEELILGNRITESGKTVIKGNSLSIGQEAFAGCTKFYENFTTENGEQAEFILPERVQSIGVQAFSGMCSSDRDYSKIPSLKIYGSSNSTDRAFGSVSPLVDGKYPTIQIFDNAQFKNVTIGGKVSCLAEDAFKNDNGIYSKLTGNLTIESTVDSVWRQAFYNCSGFDGVLTLGLDYNSETGVLNDGVENIGDEAFSGCVKFSQGLRIPPSVKNIGQNAFNSFASDTQSPGFLKIEGSSGTKTVGNTEYQMIGKNIFNNSKFKDITIGWNTRLIEENFISNNSLITGNVNIGANVTVIEESAFENCSGLDGELYFKTEWNNGIRNIGKKAFSGCTNFYTNHKTTDGSQAEFVIPQTVTTIGADAFYKFSANSTNPALLKIEGTSESDGTLGNGKDAIFNYSKFNNIVIGGNVKKISSRFMMHYKENGFDYDYSYITGQLIIMGCTVGFNGTDYFENSIGDSAFYNCGISSAIFPGDGNNYGLHGEYMSKLNNVFGNSVSKENFKNSK